MEKSFFEIVKNANNGDEKSIMEVLERFDKTIKKFSRELEYEMAETDLIIALIEGIQKLEFDNFKVENDGIIVNYIYCILKNKKIDLLRKYIKQKNREIQVDFNILEIPDEFIYENNLMIEELFKMLTENQKDIIVSKFFLGYSDQEIAKEFNISRQAVNKTKNKALEKMKNYYNEF